MASALREVGAPSLTPHTCGVTAKICVVILSFMSGISDEQAGARPGGVTANRDPKGDLWCDARRATKFAYVTSGIYCWAIICTAAFYVVMHQRGGTGLGRIALVPPLLLWVILLGATGCTYFFILISYVSGGKSELLAWRTAWRCLINGVIPPLTILAMDPCPKGLTFPAAVMLAVITTLAIALRRLRPRG